MVVETRGSHFLDDEPALDGEGHLLAADDLAVLEEAVFAHLLDLFEQVTVFGTEQVS